jgi:hypothetical protein
MRTVSFNPEIKKVVDSILLKYPLVQSGKMFGYPAYYVNKKLVACIYESGVGIKVPEDVAKTLIGKEGIGHFHPLGRPEMKEWIQINHQKPDDYLEDTAIFEASVNFVSSINKSL